jgi:glycosyltransferase involved in cell wall biosynthesis
MNKGIALVKGDIIGILNVDDYYEPGTLLRVVELFKTLPKPGLLVGNCNLWGDEEVLLDVNRPSHLRLTDLLIGDEARYPFPVNPSAYFYHRSLHDKIGLYNVEERYAMDIDFLLRAIPHAHVAYLDEVLGNYRLIRGTKTSDDMVAGRMETRLQQLIRVHRKKLPLYQRHRVILIGQLYRFWRTIQKRARKG